MDWAALVQDSVLLIPYLVNVFGIMFELVLRNTIAARQVERLATGHEGTWSACITSPPYFSLLSLKFTLLLLFYT